MPLMSKYEDNYFELAIVDPPYGILSKMGDRLDKYSSEEGGKEHRDWDSQIPTDDYFKELQRISKNQIIWGGNYFPYLWKDGCKGFIFWYKHQPIKNWAAGELAWTSFNKPAMCFDYMSYGGVNQDRGRFHPTQKPVSLYEFCLMEYAKEGDKILDTHLGSGSIAKACHNLGYSLTACEINTRYFEQSLKELEYHKQQLRMF